ncbi:MFS transporter [Streptomyces alkaliterrae]|uniref:MFS transporter n=1 Tax=Streptomyces alkaliterrae TaxID=2213162 RepID=A0A7W3X0X0_9ACTN|nr:MFS transporter [Streptomyces alkaliterrae]MBB1261875.1 MFS transporter [Streptomyces alkaliterrae]
MEDRASTIKRARLRRTRRLAPLTIGLVVSAAGVGGLVSSLLLARFLDVERWQVLLAVVLVVNGAAAGALALLADPLWLAVVVLVLDGASALAFVVVATTRQRITADALRGRVIAASSAMTGAARMLALAGAGLLIDVIGPRGVLLLLAALALPVGMLLGASGPAVAGRGSEGDG